MAYFANSTEGDVFYEQCAICKYGEEPCPIRFIQLIYNDGTCSMFVTFRKDFYVDAKNLKLDI